MNEYYVFSDGKELGPFLIPDLKKRQQLSPDTLVRNAEGGGGWKPAGQIDELKPLLQTTGALKPRVLPGWLSARRVGIVLLLLFAVGAVLFFLMRKGKEVATMHHKEHIRAIHDSEVQKAIQELNAEKQSKKREAERKELFRQRKAELRGLDAQLEAVIARKANALAELDDIRRLHLFRSRARKERQVAQQLQLIESLEAKALGLRSKIANCKAALDTLSTPANPE